MISGNQIKAARALIGIDQESLALAAGICPQTLVHLASSGAAPTLGRKTTLESVLDALKARGAVVVPHGVMLGS
jgi:DNA-binding XRE family transcriptional regulator